MKIVYVQEKGITNIIIILLKKMYYKRLSLHHLKINYIITIKRQMQIVTLEKSFHKLSLKKFTIHSPE